jgi:deoxycytidine triphosphate deaminase
MILTAKQIKLKVAEGVKTYGKSKLDVSYSKSLIVDIDPNQMDFMEGGAYDLRIAEIMRIVPNQELLIGVDERVTPITETITNTVGDRHRLAPQDYVLIRTIETVNLPPYLVGILTSRTTAMRNGCEVPDCIQPFCAMAHPNYKGKLIVGIRNVMPLGSEIYTTIEVGARIVSMIFAMKTGDEGDLYSGFHQNGVISSQGKPVVPY